MDVQKDCFQIECAGISASAEAIRIPVATGGRIFHKKIIKG